MTTFETYGTYARSGDSTGGSGEYEISDADWEELETYLDSISDSVRQVTRSQGIEEDAPRMRSPDNRFQPHGWVGDYPGDIAVVPDKLPQQPYQEMVASCKGLIESFGLRTAEAALPFSPEILNDARALYLRYSESLIAITEAVVSNRLPMDIEEQTHTGYELQGRPAFDQTVAIRSQGRPETVSRSVTFTFETLTNRLLVQFHRELRTRLQGLSQEFDIADSVLQSRLGYHETFIESVIPAELRDLPPEDLSLTIVEAQALTEEATGSIAELVDLWEAYRRQLSTELDPYDRFESAIKPASKVYELWCLTQILEILRAELGHEQSQSPSNRLPSRFTFDGGVTLHYDTSFSEGSKYIKPVFRSVKNTQAGSPDFLLTIDGNPRWVADAKFQVMGDINLAPSQRFLSYVVDYLDQSVSHGSALLCVNGPCPDQPADIEGYRFFPVGLRPDTDTGALDVVEKELTRLLS